MPGLNDSPKWILKCRDLVELYYGVRMVMSVIENSLSGDGGWDTLILQDPRRIRYEIIIANSSPTDMKGVQIGTPPTFNLGTTQLYNVNPGETIVIERNFLTDGDAVNLPLNFEAPDATVTVSTRETFLTPLPVDET